MPSDRHDALTDLIKGHPDLARRFCAQIASEIETTLTERKLRQIVRHAATIMNTL